MQFSIGHRILRRRLNSCLWRQLKQHQHNKARIILLPEVPTDTAENNAFMRCIENQDLPDFGAWSIKDAVNGSAKFGLEYEGWLLEHFEHMAESASDAPSSFASLLDPLESHSVPVDFAWYTFSQQYAVLFFGNKNAESHAHGLEKLMVRLAYTRYSAPEFHKALKDLVASKKVADGWQRRLVDNYLLECRLNGLDLRPHKSRQLGEIREAIERKKLEYREHIPNSSIKLHDKPVEDFAELSDAPEHVLRCLANQPEGPLRLPFSVRYSPRRFALYLQYCKKRMHRWAWWGAVNGRAAFSEDMPVFNNSLGVEEIRQIRQREASWLGHKTYADMQLSVCMARSVDEVKEFLTKFGEKASDQLDAVYEDMCRLADAEGENTRREPPDAWDLPYYARRVANEKCKLDRHRFAEYFPYPQTMKNILSGVERLFGVEFSESKSTPKWHPSVETYEIRSAATGEYIAHFFIDPYSRNGKALATFAMPGRPQSDTVKTSPIAYLNLDLAPPTADKPSLIYLDQLAALAFELGRALQFVLSAAPYSSMLGDKLIEWDCKNVCARVMELLIAGRPHALVDISHHYQNGQKIDLKLAETHVRGRVLTNLPAVVREVVESELDLSMYSTRAFWRDLYRDLHAKYLPYKWDKRKGDEFVCSFGGFVTENIAAKYYSVLWAKKLASDIVEAFEEVKGNEDAVAEVGKRYADVYLANGGRQSQEEMFRKFRGRDPILEPMIKFYASV